MPKQNNLQQTYFFNVLIINLVSITFLGSIWVLHEIYQYRNETKILREEFIESQKTSIKNEVENAIEYIDKINTTTEKDLNASLETRTVQILQLVNSVYISINNNQKELQIKRLLKQINSKSKNNYIFIISGNQVEDLSPPVNGFEKYAQSDRQRLADTLSRIKNKKKLYLGHTIYSDNKIPKQLVLFFEEFRPLNWLICTGIDYNDFVKSRQYDVILRLSDIRFGKNREGYLFANFQNADPLLTNGLITIGQANNWELEDPHGVKIMQKQYEAAQKPEGDYIQYSWRKIFTQEEKAYGIEKPTSPKISFIKGYKPWNWMVGAGFYMDDIELAIARKRTVLYNIIKKHVIVITFTLFISILVTLMLVRVIQKRLNFSYNRFINFFNEASVSLAKIEPEILYYKEFQDLAQCANQMVEQRVLAEQGFKQIVEVFPFPICIYNQRTVLYLNPQWFKIIGYTTAEVPTLSRMLVKCFAEKEERKFIQHLKNGDILHPSSGIETLFKILCKDGAVRFMRLNYIEMKNNNSMLTLEDYTQRKKIEDDLNAARLKAEESDSLKSAFLANMSHEIRTPMNAIIGFSGLLQNDSLPVEKRRRYLDLIHKSSEALLNLINDILDISKIEAGQMNFQIEKGNLKETFAIVDAEIKSIRRTFQKENVDIVTTYILSDEESIIETDFLRLRQVLMNLLSNALKFTNNGKIEYGCRRVKANTLEFFVKDTGIGIKPTHLSSVFNRFTKIEDDRTKVFRGAGLGLAISKKIVESLGGKIDVKSVYGEGSAFCFTLPLNHKRKTMENLTK